MSVVVPLGVGVGLLVGSFLNVVIARVPVGESVVHPPSHCPKCGTELAPYDNIPVLSWLMLRAKCRTCRAPISARYPLVEAGTALAFGLVAARIGWEPELAAYLVATAGLISLAFIDIDTKRIPNVILYPLTAVVAVLLVVAAAVNDQWDDLARAGIAAAIGFGALFLIHFVRPDGMGFGDVKLAFLCGGLLGWFGLTEMIVGLYGGFVLGAVVGVLLIASKRASFGRTIPFGPFLVLGTLLTVIAGDPVADAMRDFFS
jgi:leader peptidase (prepilin peptidase)/N-methyltransferase